MNTGFLLSLLLGWLVGGSANWAADHLPSWGETSPPRFHWQHYWTLPWWWRRRDCPTCATSRPWRAPAVELTMAALFGASWLHFHDQVWALVIVWLYAAFLLVVLVIDFEHRRVLNLMLGPAAVIALLLSLVPGMPGLRLALLGSAAGFGFFFFLYLLGRGKLGAGDVKLAGVIGLMVGYPAVWSALVMGVVLGGVAAVALLISRRAGRKSYMAYAPYLAVGALVTLWRTFG